MANTEHTARPSLLARWLAGIAGRRVADTAPVHPDVRFEESDVNAQGVVLAGFGLLVAVWVIVLLLHFVFVFFANYRASVGPPPLPLAGEQNRLPPAPQLEVSPRTDLKDFRAYEDSRLNNYYWADRQKGTVGIPIEHAMHLIAQRGIPPQKAPASLKLSPPTAGTRMTGFEGKVEPEPR